MKKLILKLALVLAFLLIPVLALAGADIELSWDSNSESDMSHYNMYRSQDNSVPKPWTKLNVDPIVHIGEGSEFYTDYAVPDGTYYWYVTAVDDSGNESGPSNVVSKTIDSTAPAPPSGLVAKIIQLIASIFKFLFGWMA